jgi:predicted AAA+ superfamily ATPase
MEITTFNLSNPWRTGRDWDVPGIQRDVTRKLMNWLDEPEILILSGARQVGKTSILYQLIDWLMRSGHVGPDGIYYFNLDLGGISEFLEDQGSFLRFLDAEKGRNIFVFIDEVQRLPDPGIFIKAIQDLRLPIKFILTGSSSLDIRTRTHEPLTGRKQVFHIEALSFSEYVKTVPVLSSLPALEQQNYSIYMGALNDALNDYGLYGGYPAVVLSNDPEKKILRLNEIFSSYLEKDIAGFLKVENIPAFRKLATLLSVQQGGLVNIQELASTLGLHRETITRYIYYLEKTFVIKRLTPLFSNPRTELSKMPKIYFADAGLRNLAMGSFSDLRTRSDTGKIIEGIVASHVLKDSILSHRINYWRTKSGAEVDLVLSGAKAVQSIEVKSGFLKGVTISRGYRSFLSKYSPKKAILLNSAVWSTREIDGHTVEAIPTAVFLLRDTESDKKERNI